MSKKETETAEAADKEVKEEQKTAGGQEAATEQEGKETARVYCGPSVRGVARQFTVYTREIPQELDEFFKAHPAAKSLLVPIDRFAQTRKKLETAGTAEAILFKKVRSEL
jgi:hypothetical protein